MKPDYENLYMMRDPFATRPMRLSVEGDPRFGTKTFDDFVDRLYLGECEADPPLQLKVFQGGQKTDLMWSAYPPITVISKSMVKLLSAHGFTGWGTYAVKVRDRDGKIIPGYFGLAVTGRAGKSDLLRGKVIKKPPKVPGGAPYEVLKGEYFKDDFWDGSDFCIMGQGGSPIVTRRVVDALKKAKIRNVEFMPLPEYEIDIGALEIMGLWPPTP